MGAIWFDTREFGGILSDAAGYKSGLALSEERLREFLTDGDYADLWPLEDGAMRVRSEVFEEVYAYVLHRVGVGAPRYEPYPVMTVWHQVKNDPERLAVFEAIAPSLLAFLSAQAEERTTAPIDPRPFVEEAAATHGPVGAKIAVDLVASIANTLSTSPWSPMRRREWDDIRDLDELFSSEQLASPHGTYFDQRFANFLATNFDAIDRINWRQFEGLAAEHFKREGFAVELGPGRGDGGVDIRLWPSDDAREGGPAAVLVQCKRERARVSSTVVKALWADMQAEGARGGMVVTTSALAPSAKAVRTARDYDVHGAERETLRAWVEKMRTPGTGVFLAK